MSNVFLNKIQYINIMRIYITKVMSTNDIGRLYSPLHGENSGGLSELRGSLGGEIKDVLSGRKHNFWFFLTIFITGYSR